MKHIQLFENFSHQPMEVTICMDPDCMVQSVAEIKFEGEIPHIVSGDLWNELPSVFDDQLDKIFGVYKDAGLSVEKSRIYNLSNPDISYRGAGREKSGEFTANSLSINDKLKTGELRLREGESRPVAQWDGTAWSDNKTPQYYLEVVS